MHELAGCVCIRVQVRAVLEHLNIIISLYFIVLVVNRRLATKNLSSECVGCYLTEVLLHTDQKSAADSGAQVMRGNR